MNIFIGRGRCAKEPERKTEKMVVFTIAISRIYKAEGQPDADFFDCKCFGKTAEFVEKYAKKGMFVAVHGSIENGSYKNKDGQTIRTQTVACQQVELDLPSKKSSETSAPKGDSGNFMDVPNVPNEELPFG